jgi:hypothetical protein
LLRRRLLRDPGRLSDEVEHLDRTARGDPDVAVRPHRERNVTDPRPCLVSIHGGGHVNGTHRGDDGRFDRWTRALCCIGISVGYRLAPEAPFPGPVADGYTALRWVHDDARDLGVDEDWLGHRLHPAASLDRRRGNSMMCNGVRAGLAGAPRPPRATRETKG